MVLRSIRMLKKQKNELLKVSDTIRDAGIAVVNNSVFFAETECLFSSNWRCCPYQEMLYGQ